MSADARQSGELLGWHVIYGGDLLRMLRRVADGEDPDMVYAEEYVNAEREQIDGPDAQR